MAHNLYVDSEALASTGTKVKEVAEQTRSLMDRIRSEIESLDSIWSGEVKTTYVDKALEKTAEINNLVREFEEAGVGLNRSGNNYSEAADEVHNIINF